MVCGEALMLCGEVLMLCGEVPSASRGTDATIPARRRATVDRRVRARPLRKEARGPRTGNACQRRALRAYCILAVHCWRQQLDQEMLGEPSIAPHRTVGRSCQPDHNRPSHVGR
jgi:hypothetical protein